MLYRRLYHLPTVALLLALPFSTHAMAKSLHERNDVKAFINQLVKQHQFKRNELEQLFLQTEISQEIIDAINRPAEKKPWHQYRPIFVTDSRAQEGAKFLNENRQALNRAEEKYGVPAEIITAIIGVETRYGRYKGKYRVVDALATLGFEYPPRGEFFRKELKEFLLLSREESFDPLAITGSYAGAIGKPQFISSSYRRYAVDFNGDGVRDLQGNSADAIGSVANYLARHGWQRQRPVAVPAQSKRQQSPKGKLEKPKKTVAQWRKKGVETSEPLQGDMKAMLVVLENQNEHEYWLGLNNFYAITRYNHSPLYAMAVYQLSQAIKERDRQRQVQAAD